MKIPFARPDLTEAEFEAVQSVLSKGWLTHGPKTLELEAKFKSELGDVECVAVSSATAGFELLFASPLLRPKRYALFPTWTYSSPAMAAHKADMQVVLCDVSAEDLCMSPDDMLGSLKAIDRAKNAQDVIVVPTHFAGNACEIDRMGERALEIGATVIEDAAHAYPTVTGGKLVGSHRPGVLAAVYSFYATKTISCGEGGMVVTADRELADWLRVARRNGMTHGAWNAGGFAREDYDIADFGFKANMSDVLAALGCVQFDRAHEMLDGRRAIHEAYEESFVGSAITLMEHQQGSAYHLCVAFVPERDAFVDYLTDHGVGTSKHFKPLHRMSFWAKTFRGSSMMLADGAWDDVVSLPLYSSMTGAEVERVIEVCRKADVAFGWTRVE